MSQSSQNSNKDSGKPNGYIFFSEQDSSDYKNMIPKINQITSESLNRLNTAKQSHNAPRQINRRYRWTILEQRRYLKFIEENKTTLEEDRKADKQYVFNRMAKFIGTKRKPVNCKSHHQKVLHKYKSIDRILRELPLELKKREEILYYEQMSQFVQIQFQQVAQKAIMQQEISFKAYESKRNGELLARQTMLPAKSAPNKQNKMAEQRKN